MDSQLLIPDNCACGGALEWKGMSGGEEFFWCKTCSEIYSRYIDTIGG